MDVTRLNFSRAADVERWRRYVMARPDAHATDLAEWRLLYHELYRIEDHSYLCLDGDAVVGALSLYHIRSPFLGRMLVTCPFFGYGGAYWERDEARDALLARAASVARELGVDYLELRLDHELPPPYRANRDFAEFHLDLAATPEATWSRRLSSNARQNVRKARAVGALEFRLSSDPAAVYDLLRRTLRAHGTPFHGARFFRLLTAHLGRHVQFSEIWLRGSQLVAGGIVLQVGSSLLTPYIGSLARHRGLRPNYLQYWALVEHAHAQGIRRFEMGRSPRGSTHAQFKEKWGCAELPLYYNYLVLNPRKRHRSVSAPTPLERLAVAAWKRLPLALTTALGPRLYRHIP